jgi:Uri superfamily endonuclease
MQIKIGRLGILKLQTGYYIYLGSAFGPGGLLARTRRHREKTGPKHWHIDYLKPWIDLRETWYTHDPTRREHQWATALLAETKASVPLPGFGSSDCRCETHLVHFSSKPDFDRCCRAFTHGVAGHALIARQNEA